MEESQDQSDPRKYQENCEDFNLEAFCRVTAGVVAYRENVVALEGGLLFHILNQCHASFFFFIATLKEFVIEPMAFITVMVMDMVIVIDFSFQ